MVQYKLYYFNSRGAGELARLMFAYKNTKFEDIRFTSEQWPKEKPNMPFGAMPVLEVDGVKICQSAAIARYLAKEFGLMGTNALEAFRIDEIQEMVVEMFSKHFVKIFSEKDATTKKEMLNQFIDKDMKPYLEFFKKRLAENTGSDYLVGKTLSLADLAVFRALEMFGDIVDSVDKSMKSKIPSVKQVDDLCKKVAAEPNIAKWIKARPESTF